NRSAGGRSAAGRWQKEGHHKRCTLACLCFDLKKPEKCHPQPRTSGLLLPFPGILRNRRLNQPSDKHVLRPLINPSLRQCMFLQGRTVVRGTTLLELYKAPLDRQWRISRSHPSGSTRQSTCHAASL